MKKYQVLYDWLSSEISKLTNSDDAENFAASLSDAKETIYVALSEELRGLGAEIASAYADHAHFSHWAQLRHNIHTYSSTFPEFPNAQFRKLQAVIVFASMLASTGAVLDEEDVNEQLFELRSVPMQFPFNWLARENRTTFENSLVVLACVNPSGFESDFLAGAGQISPKLLFHVLATLAFSQNPLAGHVAFIKKVQPEVPSHTVTAFVQLHILAEGKEIHSPRIHNSPPEIGDFEQVDPRHPYEQWNEIFVVLSEYNSRTEAMLKFLTIYHVIENLMFKRPLVELESRQNGRMFSIRNFRQMYENVEMNESTALGKLFSAVFQVNANGTSTIEQSILARWQHMMSTAPVADVESALRALILKKTHNQFVAGNAAPAFFTDLVYKLRCAIVHNKETEFHLTHSTMSNGFIAIIESFLLPSLEELSFTLISRRNAYVWYSNQDLKLY